MIGVAFCKYLTKSTPRILMYHRFSDDGDNGTVSREQFENQIIMLKKDFKIISLEKLVALIAGNYKVPHNIIVLTIDDGYRDFYQFAYPILKKHSVPATFFVTTSFVDQSDWLWPDKISYLLQSSKTKGLVVKFNNENYFELDGAEVWEKIIDYLVMLPNKKRIKAIKKLADTVSVHLPEHAPDKYAAVTWSQLNEMKKNGIEIGSHTLSHPILSTIEDTSILENEIIESKRVIEGNLAVSISSFCFPNGQKSDYNDETIKIVRKAGYSCSVAATFDKDLYGDIYTIGRISAGTNMNQFKKSAYGYEILSLRIRSALIFNKV